MSRVPDKVQQAVYARADYKCERCGIPIANIWHDPHHRRTAGMGGNKAAHFTENIALLCRPCHDWVGANSGAEAADTGWYVHQWEAPETVPMTNLAGERFIFDGDQVIYL